MMQLLNETDMYVVLYCETNSNDSQKAKNYPINKYLQFISN